MFHIHGSFQMASAIAFDGDTITDFPYKDSFWELGI